MIIPPLEKAKEPPPGRPRLGHPPHPVRTPAGGLFYEIINGLFFMEIPKSGHSVDGAIQGKGNPAVFSLRAGSGMRPAGACAPPPTPPKPLTNPPHPALVG